MRMVSMQIFIIASSLQKQHRVWVFVNRTSFSYGSPFFCPGFLRYSMHIKRGSLKNMLQSSYPNFRKGSYYTNENYDNRWCSTENKAIQNRKKRMVKA